MAMAALALSTALWTSHPTAASASGPSAASQSGQEARFQPADNMLPRFNHFHTAAQQPYESVPRRGLLEDGRERGKPQAESGTAAGHGQKREGEAARAAAPPARSSSRRASNRRKREARKWHDRRGGQIDSEFDVVIVPSDGISMSGSESDDSDWSVGWFEPHCPDFLDNDSEEDSFAVLVPCYGSSSPKLALERSFSSQNEDSHVPFWTTMRLSPKVQRSNAEDKRELERWLAALHE